MSEELLGKDWDAVDAYFDYGIDVTHRRVFLFGEFDEERVNKVIKGLYFLSGTSDDLIELYVSSEGGSVYEMFGLLDVISLIANKVQTIAVGKCMSAAPLIVAAGTRGDRWSMPNTQWMVHMGDSELGSSRVEGIEDELKHNKNMNELWYKLMAKCTGTEVKVWRARCKKVGDNYFDAEEARELGLVDNIWIGPEE